MALAPGTSLGRYEIQAAKLYGATEGMMERDGSGRPHADALYLDPLLAMARKRIGSPEFARAEAEGRTLSFEDAVAEAGRWLLLGSVRDRGSSGW
jgi:hypothetical protein